MTSLGDFTPQADAYRTARPNYPEVLIDRLTRLADVRSGDAVADLGAGTGIFTTQLAARGLRVSAIEPNAAMRDQAQASADSNPSIRWLDGEFENLPLEDASQDWAVAAQAFHWADPPRALPQIARVLKPGRCFSVLWNDRLNHQSPILRQAWATIKHFVPDFEGNYRQRDWPTVLTSTGDFADVRHEQQRHVIVMTRERFVNLWRSHNRLSVTAGPQVLERVIEAIKRQVADSPTIDMPYLCRAWTVRKR